MKNLILRIIRKFKRKYLPISGRGTDFSKTRQITTLQSRQIKEGNKEGKGKAGIGNVVSVRYSSGELSESPGAGATSAQRQQMKWDELIEPEQERN